MATIFADVRFLRGPEERLPSLEEGQPAFTEDTKRIFVGSDEGNVELAKQETVEVISNQLVNKATVLQQDTLPEDAEEGAIWLDTSDNAYQGTVFEKLSNQMSSLGVNPESFGLDENADDNYQAIIDTFSFISTMQNGKGKIVFPQGKVFKFTQPLGTQTLSNITIDLNGSTLDFSAVSTTDTGTALMFSGTLGNGVPLTANATEGSKIIQCATSGIVVGDMVKVYSNRLWDSTQTSTRTGEICFVQSIDSPTQLTLTTPINDTYNTADVASLAKITPVKNIVIMNGTLIGATGSNEMRGLRITRGYNCLIQNVRTNGFDVWKGGFTWLK
jgi:hypothetical protein